MENQDLLQVVYNSNVILENLDSAILNIVPQTCQFYVDREISLLDKSLDIMNGTRSIYFFTDPIDNNTDLERLKEAIEIEVQDVKCNYLRLLN